MAKRGAIVHDRKVTTGFPRAQHDSSLYSRADFVLTAIRACI